MTNLTTQRTPPPRHAVVVGGSLAGLLAARVLADHVDRVTVIERDPRPEGAVTHKGVPQARHAHALLEGGRRALESLLPGFTADAVAAGAMLADVASTSIWHQGGAPRVRFESGIDGTCLSRALLDHVVRTRVESHERISVDYATRAVELVAEDGRGVTGIRVERDGVVSEVHAELVIDATGRAGAMLRSLEALGFDTPRESVVNCNMAYSTCVVPRHPTDLDGATYLLSTSDQARGVFVLPIEGARWMITLAGMHGDSPPAELPALADFARTLATPEAAEMLAAASAGTEVVTHRMACSRRRRVERLRRPPAGFLLLGDSICSFNPVYGQGMSSAALQAVALGAVLDRTSPADPRLPRRFYRRAARIIDNPWMVASMADFAHPATTGDRLPGTALVNRYVGSAIRTGHHSIPVARQLYRVQHLLAGPASLFRPDLVARVAFGAMISRWNPRRSTSLPPQPAPSPGRSTDVLTLPH